MPQTMQSLIEQYIAEIKKIYGTHLRKIILYGSYARGDFRPDSDIDIMILLDISDVDLKAYSQQLSYWVVNYPFYANINKEGVVLYGAAYSYYNKREIRLYKMAATTF